MDLPQITTMHVNIATDEPNQMHWHTITPSISIPSPFPSSMSECHPKLIDESRLYFGDDTTLLVFGPQSFISFWSVEQWC